jgi:D-serine dehydratase
MSDHLPGCSIHGKLEAVLDAVSGQWYLKTDSHLDLDESLEVFQSL